MHIMLSSGIWIGVDQVKLYRINDVGEISSLRARAAKALGGSGHIVGVVGAPSWTLAAEATALSLVTGFLQGAIQKQAAEALRRAQALYEAMLESSGHYFEVSQVKKIRVPHPLAWSAERHGVEHVHSGDDFLWMRSGDGEFAVQWQHISMIAEKRPTIQAQRAIETEAKAPAPAVAVQPPAPSPPPETGTESGIPWRRLPDGRIEATIAGQMHSFAGLTALRIAVTEARHNLRARTSSEPARREPRFDATFGAQQVDPNFPGRNR